jgi:hypothetical protein
MCSVRITGLALSEGPKRVSPSHLKAETYPESKTLCTLVFEMPDDGIAQNPECLEKSKIPLVRSVMYHCQNPRESTPLCVWKCYDTCNIDRKNVCVTVKFFRGLHICVVLLKHTI